MGSFYSFLIFILWLRPPLCHFKQSDRRSKEVIIYEENEREPNKEKKNKMSWRRQWREWKKINNILRGQKLRFLFLLTFSMMVFSFQNDVKKKVTGLVGFKLILSFKRWESNEWIIVLLKIRVVHDIWTVRPAHQKQRISYRVLNSSN